MTKHAREEIEVAGGDQANEVDVASAAAPAAVERCVFCRLPFKIYRCRCNAKSAKLELPLPLHHRGQLDDHQQNDPQHPRKYRFPIADEHVLNHLRSFLINQSHSKLQLATGGRYPSREPLFSRYCCACEEDRPAQVDGLCSTCKVTKRGFETPVTETLVKRFLGLMGLTDVPGDVRPDGSSTFYSHDDLERHAQAKFGSRRAWMRSLARQRRDEHRAFLAKWPASVAFANRDGLLKRISETKLREGKPRFDMLAIALKQRGLGLPTDSHLCSNYIARGVGTHWQVASSMEDKALQRSHRNNSRWRGAELNREAMMSFSAWVVDASMRSRPKSPPIGRASSGRP